MPLAIDERNEWQTELEKGNIPPKVLVSIQLYEKLRTDPTWRASSTLEALGEVAYFWYKNHIGVLMKPTVTNGYKLSLQNKCNARGFYYVEDDWSISEYGKSIEECIELLLPRYKFAIEENDFSLSDITIVKVTYIEYDGRIFLDQHEKPEEIKIDDRIDELLQVFE